ncbi:MAG: SGNH/GDSL hydrolase family protein [Bacteroidota bacterium]
MQRPDAPTKQLLFTALGFAAIALLFIAIGLDLIPVPEGFKKTALTHEDGGQHRHNILPTLDDLAVNPSEQEESVSNDSLSNTSLLNDSFADTLKSIYQLPGAELPLDSANMVIGEAPKTVFHGDTTKKERIMLLGDSQCGGLRYPVYSYCALNGHKLLATVTWNSSTTKSWANTDTLDYFLREHKPTLVIMCVGLNEILSSNMKSRKKYIETINTKIAAAGAKVFWLGPAAWVKDMGIIQTIKDVNGSMFFDATTLSLDRAEDGRHPTKQSYRHWFSHAAAYMTQAGVVDFSISSPFKNMGRKTVNVEISPNRQ